jgi:hypothetical protein
MTAAIICIPRLPGIELWAKLFRLACLRDRLFDRNISRHEFMTPHIWRDGAAPDVGRQ